jgi:virginiamycin B lyase
VLPSGADSQPYGTALDAAGILWIVNTGADPNQLIGIDTATDKILSVTPIPSGAGIIRHMHYFAAEGEVWFGTDAATVGRAQVAAP